MSNYCKNTTDFDNMKYYIKMQINLNPIQMV